MTYLFFSIFAILILLAVICQLYLVILGSRLRTLENRIIERYHSKIDKIPALLCVLGSHSTKLMEYKDLTELHRIAIISSTNNIFDVLEINAHITDRFGFLMRLALVIKSTTKDGNFITIRENITIIEGQIRELLSQYSAQVRDYNSVIKAREYTIFGALLPGRKKAII